MSGKRNEVSNMETGKISSEQSYLIFGESRVQIAKMGYKTEYCVYKNVGDGRMLYAGSATGICLFSVSLYSPAC